MLATFVFRLRPPLRVIPSRGYSSPSFSQEPLTRPYSWWLKARYRPDGTRRSIFRGILHGAFYISVAAYAYRQYPQIKDNEALIRDLSQVAELQRINRKYHNSAFTEPAEIRAFLSEIAEVEIVPGMSWCFTSFCEEYETLLECFPENRQRVQERIFVLQKILEIGPSSSKLPFFASMVIEVQSAWNKLLIEMLEMHFNGTLKQANVLLSQHGRQ